MIGSYDALERPSLKTSFLPGHKSGAENYALAADLAVPLVTEWFGAPRQKAETVDLADPEAASFESGPMLLTPLGSTNSAVYELSAVHQLTHAAFFSSRAWIYEGLAHFAQALEREQQNGRPAALDFMGRHRTAIVDTEKALAAAHSEHEAANQSLINTSIEEFYRSKAMYVWWMLRDMVGDAALTKALSAYHSDQDKESAYVQHLIEAQTHRDLEWFFDDWVYRDRGLPDFRVESAYPRARVDGGSILTVTINNLGDAGAEVPVTLRMEDGEVTKRVEVQAKSKAAVRFETNSSPREIVVNDGSVPLKAQNLWMVGLDERGEQSYDSLDYNMDCAIVLGAEGKGLHDLVARKCDFLVSIPMLGKVPSLNVSVAAGVMLYEIVRQRRKKSA